MSSERDLIYVHDDAGYPTSHFFVPPHYEPYVDSVLLPAGMIRDRVEKLAHDILDAYKGKTIHLLCVLKGGSAFFQDLCHYLRLIHQYRQESHIPFTFDFIRVKSYEGTQSTGNVQISGVDLSTFKDKHLLLIEDIIDTGITMTKLLPTLEQHSPASVQVASLLEKRSAQSCGYKADFVGFSIPDAFVVGYCLDYDEAFRDLDHIGIINAAGIEHFKEK